MEEKRRWTKVEFDNIKRELELNVSINEISIRYNRTIDAIKRKFYRGYMTKQRKNSILNCFNTEDELQHFMFDYINNVNSKSLMETYNIKNLNKLYKITKELGVKRKTNIYK